MVLINLQKHIFPSQNCNLLPIFFQNNHQSMVNKLISSRIHRGSANTKFPLILSNLEPSWSWHWVTFNLKSHLDFKIPFQTVIHQPRCLSFAKWYPSAKDWIWMSPIRGKPNYGYRNCSEKLYLSIQSKCTHLCEDINIIESEVLGCKNIA